MTTSVAERRTLLASHALLACHSGWPTLAATALYGLPGKVVDALGDHTEADPAALLLSYLVAFGAAVGRGPHAQAEATEHPGRLFAVLVGDSAKARKGSSWHQIRRVFEVADPRFTRGRILGGFGSGEAVVDALAEGDDHRLLVIEPEFARILSVGRREGSTLSTLLRQGWDGDRLAVRSRGAGTVTAEGAHVCLLGHITAEELRAKLTETEMSNGYANRHLFALVRRSKLLPSGGNIDDAEVDHLGMLTRSALEAGRRVGLLRRTAAAEERWTGLYYELADDEPGGLLGSVIARDAAQVLRLSVLYALTDGSTTVDVTHIDAASAVWDYCRASAETIFGDALGDPVADKLLRAIRAAGDYGLDGREQHQALAGHASAAQMKVALDSLVSKGRVLIRTEESGGRPRRVAVACEQSEPSEQRAIR